MKKHILAGLLLITCLPFAKGQHLQLSAFSGYTFQDRIDFHNGEARISGGHTYGGMFSLVLHEAVELELLYSRQDATASAYSSSEDIDESGPVSVNYILAGGNKLFHASGKLKLFGGGKAGVGIIASKDGNFDTITKFSVHLGAGMKYFITPGVGIRIQGNLTFPVVNAGGSLWWSPGGGTHVGVSSWSPLLQFGFTGGLVFNLN